MLRTLTHVEILVGLSFILLAAGEVLTLVRARRRGWTQNRSRLFTHGAMIAIVLAILGYGHYWLNLVSSGDFYGVVGEKPVLNWPIAMLGVAAFLLALFEVLAVYEARRSGRTDNLSRLFSHVVMLLLLLALAAISLQKWEIYLDGFQAVYERSIPGSPEGR